MPAGVAESEGNWPALNPCPASLETHQTDPAEGQLETAVGVNPGGSLSPCGFDFLATNFKDFCLPFTWDPVTSPSHLNSPTSASDVASSRDMVGSSTSHHAACGNVTTLGRMLL